VTKKGSPKTDSKTQRPESETRMATSQQLIQSENETTQSESVTRMVTSQKLKQTRVRN
jgi:hypothetical protein